MSEEIHDFVLQIAEPLSVGLFTAIQIIGPLKPIVVDDLPLNIRLSRAVAGQQLSVKAAQTIWQRVVDSAEMQDLTAHLSQVDTGTLRNCGLSGSKCKTIKAIAEATDNGQICPIALKDMDKEQRTDRLTEIWGVGEWTANMISMFYFKEADIWPDGDVTARKTLTRLTSPRRKTIRTAARFSPYRSSLARYMWAIADARPD